MTTWCDRPSVSYLNICYKMSRKHHICTTEFRKRYQNDETSDRCSSADGARLLGPPDQEGVPRARGRLPGHHNGWVPRRSWAPVGTLLRIRRVQGCFGLHEDKQLQGPSLWNGIVAWIYCCEYFLFVYINIYMYLDGSMKSCRKALEKIRPKSGKCKWRKMEASTLQWVNDGYFTYSFVPYSCIKLAFLIVSLFTGGRILRKW